MVLKAKKTKSFKSLWITLATAFLMLSALVLLISSSLNMYFGLRNQRKLIINEQRFIARSAANTVRSFVQEKLSTLEAAAYLSNPAEVNREGQKLVLEKLLGLEPAFRQAILMDAKGQELANVSRLSSLVSRQLTERVESELFSKASKVEKYISSVYIDEITSEPMMIMAVAVTDIFGEFRGVLFAEVNLKFMWDLVDGIKVGNKGCAYVVDGQGNLIAFGNISRVLSGENLGYLREVGEFLRGSDEIVGEISRGIQKNYVLSCWEPLGTPSWAVVVELPVLEAYRTVFTTLIASVAVTLVSFVLAIIFGVYLSKRITKPITILRDAAAKIGEGKLDTQIEIKKKNEIGVLAAAFNQMAHDLQRTTTSIEVLNQEIAERKKTENALRKNEEFTKRIIESSSDCIKVLDLEGNLLSMSAGGQKLLEIDDIEPYLNTSFIDFWKGKERNDCFDAISKARQGETGIFYGYFETVKGKPKWWEVIITPIKDVDGSINRLLAVSRDITERKQTEQRQTQLLEKLEKTNLELNDFVYIASHDLKTPLRGIATLANWLSTDYKEKFDDSGKEKINLLMDRVGRMYNMIKGILQYSKLGRIEEKKTAVDLNETLTNVINEISIPDNFTITVENGLPIINCEETVIAQVFENIISNALKYIDKPKGQIKIGCVEKNNYWQFNIADNGPGIEEQYFKKIFQIFQTLSLRGDVESTGIGLTITKKIVEMYGGKIWLQSKVGEGTTFFFTLPKQDITEYQTLVGIK